MKFTLPLGLMMAGGIIVAGEITSYTLPANPNESEEVLDPVVSAPETPDLPNPPQLAQKPSSSDLSEPEEEFTVAFQKPTTPIKDRPPLSEKQKLIEKVRDYTMKIVCVISNTSGAGTGWFLDYELPSDGSYPTKWFVATNVHVLAACPFSSDPYGQSPQIIKQPSDSQAIYIYRWESGGYDEEMLRSKGIDYEEPDFWSSKDAKQYRSYNGSLPPSRDVLTTKVNWHRNKETPSMHIKVQDPKLLYVALDDKISYKNKEIFYTFMDFAVMEIDFPDEDSARKMTQQVYNKPENERIKVIGDVKENSQFYTAGYPGNSFNPYRSVGNYSAQQDRASINKRCPLLSYGSMTVQKWNRKIYKSYRCYYELDNYYSRGGSSGSMIIDETGTLLGLHSRGDRNNKFGYTQPIRAQQKGCYYWNSYCWDQPEYDLIVGSPHQKTSYKQQLLNHLPQVNTYLKDKYKWGTTPTEAADIVQ